MQHDRPLPRPVVAAAILDSLDRPTRLLCTSRAYPAKLRGLYEFPGGKVEAREDPRAALRRELQEELGVRLLLGKEIEPVGPEATLGQDGYPAWPILQGRTMRVWAGQLLPGEIPIPGDSHLDAVWLPLKDSLDLPWLPTNWPILTRLIRDVSDQDIF